VDTELRRYAQHVDQLRAMPIAAKPSEEFAVGLRAVLMATAARNGIGSVPAGVGPAAEGVGSAAVDVGSAADHKAARTLAARTLAARTVADRTVAGRTVASGALAGKAQAVRRVHTTATGRARTAMLIGVTAGALALSGVSAASTDSLPGDPLYQVKRSSERAQLALAGSDQSRGQLYLEFAHSRLFEAGRVSPDHLADVLADMDRETEAGVKLLAGAAVQRGDATLLDGIMSFVDRQRSDLDEMRRTLTMAGLEPMRRSFTVLDNVALRAKAIAAALARDCAISTSDNLGPNPVAC
jgi:hypothetical protein